MGKINTVQTGRGASLALIALCQIAAMALWFSASAVMPAALAASPDAPGGENQAGLPTSVCMPGFCGPAQQRIWTQFEHGEGLDPAVIPGVYAGVCYVHSDQYDPDHEHYVGFLIDESDETEGQPHLLLRFSFFAAANPFERLDVDAARVRLAEFVPPESVLSVSLYEEHAYAGYADRLFFARYWFRRDPATGRVLLVSYFGYRMTILCDAAKTAF